jgi:hypothetical protein
MLQHRLLFWRARRRGRQNKWAYLSQTTRHGLTHALTFQLEHEFYYVFNTIDPDRFKIGDPDTGAQRVIGGQAVVYRIRDEKHPGNFFACRVDNGDGSYDDARHELDIAWFVLSYKVGILRRQLTLACESSSILVFIGAVW